jgi:YD repeat-containing protein
MTILRIAVAGLVAACSSPAAMSSGPPASGLFPGPCEVIHTYTSPVSHDRIVSWYDAAGHQIGIARDSGADGRWDVVSVSLRDLAGREVAQVSVPGWHLERYQYDVQGRMARRIIAGVGGTRDLVTDFVYDGAGRLIRKGDPWWWWEYSYDDQGNLVEERLVDDDGKIRDQTLHRYDGNGRVIETRWTGEVRSVPTHSWSRTRFVHDGAGRVVAEVSDQDGVSPSLSVNGYDPAGRPTVRFFYDEGKLKQIARTTYDRYGNRLRYEQIHPENGLVARDDFDYSCWTSPGSMRREWFARRASSEPPEVAALGGRDRGAVR